MKLKEWREKNKLSQESLAWDLEEFAREKHGEKTKNLHQTTLGYWERGTLPRKFWLGVIFEFTKGKVAPGDFI